MLPVLFAVRSVWIAILFAVVGICVLWFLMRVVGDLFVWFREEFLDQHKNFRAEAAAKRKEKQAEPEKEAEADRR